MIGLQDIILAVIAYLIGSIPTSVWIGRRFFDVDVRKHGSGNSGATNSVRVLGKKAGLLVLFIDILKGWLAVGIVGLSTYAPGSPQRMHLEVALASAAILGHIFPVYVGFKGGKGVATGIGIILAFSPVVALFCLIVFILVFLLFHYVSLASMIAAASFPVWMAITSNSHHKLVLAFSIFLPLLVIFMHRKNIVRLMKNQESKIQLFKKH
ncbi:MAG TPA: glycerol-3-phosphate 1-O-acyltransferase PlsY [Bacteroidia bacterium]|nr:glycerol-3-phosphate 1-O-acyltransferase PlsY [Bacteroidia bacterium]